MSADESEAEVVIDYQGTLDNADGVTEGSFEGSLRFNGRDNLVVVDLMYRGATPALQRLNGGPRSFDLIWDAGSGEVELRAALPDGLGKRAEASAAWAQPLG